MRARLTQKLELSHRLSAATKSDLEALNETVTPNRNRPLHLRIQQEVRDNITSGKWPTGTILPNENKLAKSMGVSVGTLRRALSDLTKDGLITRHPKVGTTVTGKASPLGLKDSFEAFRLHGPGDTLADAENTIFGYQQRIATDAEAEILMLPPNTKVHKFERLRRLGGLPMMRDHVVFRHSLAPNIECLEDIPPALALHFLEAYGVVVTSLHERLSASLANEDDCRLFKRESPFSVLVIEELALDKQGRPVLVAWHRAITEGFNYINVVSR